MRVQISQNLLACQVGSDSAISVQPFGYRRSLGEPMNLPAEQLRDADPLFGRAAGQCAIDVVVHVSNLRRLRRTYRSSRRALSEGTRS